jgi:DnaK suppressor protein
MKGADNVTPSPGYKPENDPEYMSSTMLAYFKQKLLNWRHSLIADENKFESAVHEGIGQEPDHVDLAVPEVRLENELLPNLNREMTLVTAIEQALERINDGSYGYCLETGEEIGVARLEAWPVATLCKEAQEAMEEQARKLKKRKAKEIS